MKAKLLFILLFLTYQFMQPVMSQTYLGAPDCGEWVRQSKERPSDRAWLLGFMSGLNMMYGVQPSTRKNDDPLGSINSAQQIYAWMDNYCQKNPLQGTHQGGFELYLELMQKRK
jgi:hypothetical protein